MAIGVLMGSRRWSAEDAWTAILDAVKASGIGPGGVSRALLGVVTGDVESDSEEATMHWKTLLGQCH